MITAAPPVQSPVQTRRSRLAVFASVRLTVTLLVLIAATVLIGAWCPQESQVGQQKVIDMFGEEMAFNLSRWGITDIFHSPWLLTLIALLTVNMLACSFQRVFPKVRSLKQPMPWLTGREIGKLPFNKQLVLPVRCEQGLSKLSEHLSKSGYRVCLQDERLVAEFGKFGRLAPTITHIGLLTLLMGVTISSWTGFSGFQPIPLGGSLNFNMSEHSKLWIGKLPEWRVRVEATRRDDYPTGEPKQWFSDLSVITGQGKLAKREQISVNNPLTYDGVDIYQSSWGLDQIVVRFNQHRRHLGLSPMGKLYAAFLELEPGTVLIFSVRDQLQPLRLFAKMDSWPSPRLLTEIPLGRSIRLGAVDLTYEAVVPVTGLQYKSDPGLPVTLVAFAFIISGVLLAAVPHRQVWAHVEAANGLARIAGSAPATAGYGQPGSAIEDTQKACILSIGGRSVKARTLFERSLQKLLAGIHKDLCHSAGETA